MFDVNVCGSDGVKVFDVNVMMWKMVLYDWLLSGMGAVLCAGFFYWRG